MSKRKPRAKAEPVRTPAPAPVPAPAPPAEPVALTSGGTPLRRWWLLAVGGLVVIGLAAAGVWLAQPRQAAPAPVPPTAVAMPTATLLPVGSASYCRRNARFTATVGLGDIINASTSERMIKGLVMYNANLAPDQVQLGAPGVYQHPSWDDAGYLGPVTTDGDGNIYTAPSPRVSLIDNPPQGANTIYKVDTESGEMKPLVTLPTPEGAASANPYGILGLIYDCDTGSLYASTVAGSTRASEVGRLYQIDAARGEILSQHDNIDAIGVAVFNGVNGKRLYFGAARAPEIRSLALDARGGLAGDMRTDIILSEVPPYWDLRGRRLAFPARTTNMQVRAVEFNYNLVAMSETLQADFEFAYDPENDAWQVVK